MRRENTLVYTESSQRIPIRIYYDREGLPTFVDERTIERVLLPPTVFFVDEKIALSPDTLRRYANEIYYWLCFCDANDFSYMNVSELEIRHYKLWMTRSKKSDQKPLEAKTIDGRLYRVLEFYRWAKDKGLFFGSLGPPKRLVRSSAKKYRGDIWARGVHKLEERPLEGGAFLSNVSIQTIVRPLSRGQILACYDVLGGSSSGHLQPSREAHRHLRNRLLFDLMLKGGMRRGEVANSITLSTLERAEFASKKTDEVRLWIKGKGNKPRHISLTRQTLDELRSYSENGRRKSVNAKIRRGSPQQIPQTSALFLTHDFSTRPGECLTRERVSAIIKSIFAAADERLKKVDPSEHNQGLSRHCAHDLRHTFAVLLYYSLISQGFDRDSALKQVQIRLGHSSVATTEEYYARFTEEFRSYDDFCYHLSA